MLTDVSLGLWSTLSYSGEESPEKDATMQKTRMETGKRLSPMSSFVCLDPAVPGIPILGTLYFVMKNKILFVYTHWNWDSEACKQEFHNSSEQRWSLCIFPSRPGVGSGTKQQNSRWVPGFQPVIPDWASSHVFPMEERIRKSWAIWWRRTFEG